MNFFHSLLDFLGIQVDGDTHAVNEAHHGPPQLKNVAEGQEAQRDIVVGVEVGDAHAVSQHGGIEVGMGEHHSLGLSGSAAGVDEIHHVGRDPCGTTLVDFVLEVFVVAKLHKLLIGQAHLVVGQALNTRVERDQIGKRLALVEQLQSQLILALVAGKKHARATVVDDILGLALAAGGIDGHRDGAVVERRKVRDEDLGAVLGEDGNLALRLNPGFI